MKRKILNTISLAGRIFPLETLLNIANKRNICLVYHTVNDEVPLHVKHLYRPRTTSEFNHDVDFLGKHFNFVSTTGIGDNISRVKRSIHLTFDDGLSACYDTIRPLLLQKGIPAIFFLNPSFIGNDKMFHCHKASLLKEVFLTKKTALHNDTGELIPERSFLKTIISIAGFPDAFYNNLAEQLGVDFESYLRQYRPYLSLEQVHKMKAEGFEFGGHTLTHPFLQLLTEKDQIDEMTGSFQWLKGNQITDAEYFAFPFTDTGIGKSLFLKMRELGISQSFGTSDLKEDIFESHHHRISFENSENEAAVILKQQLFKYILLKLIGRHKIQRQ